MMVAGIRLAHRIFTLLALVVVCTPGFAQTYRGVLVPDTPSAAIPIVVEIEESKGTLGGKVTASSPLAGEGEITAGERKRSVCNFKTDLGENRKIMFEGYCLSSAIEGKYVANLPDGKAQRGTYRLMRDPDKVREESTPLERPRQQRTRAPTPASCLAANTACLAACPRGEYDAEFVCANRCRQRYRTCKANAIDPLDGLQSPLRP